MSPLIQGGRRETVGGDEWVGLKRAGVGRGRGPSGGGGGGGGNG